METNLIERQVGLKPYHSYRILLDYHDEIEIKLKSGTAEIFGAELSQNAPYKFKGVKFALLTWSKEGCIFTIKGKTQHEYFWDEGKNLFTPKSPLYYINIHAYLNQQRELALIDERVLITGSNQSGKSTLSKILINYAVKTGWKPIFCDLDVSNNEIFTQGTIGATVMESYYPDNFFEMKSLCFFHGYPDYSNHIKLYREQVRRMGTLVKKKLDEDLKKSHQKIFTPNDGDSEKELNLYQEKSVCFSGTIVNMGPWKNTVKKKEVLECVLQAFDIDTVIVIDDESLFSIIQTINPQLVVETIQKSGGVIQVDEGHKIEKNKRKFKEYFYPNSFDLMRNNLELKAAEFRVYEVRTLSDEVLPAFSNKDDVLVFPIELKKLSKYKMIGVLELTKNESETPSVEEITSSPLAFLVYITDINHNTGKVSITYLGPENLNWKNRICMISDISINLMASDL